MAIPTFAEVFMISSRDAGGPSALRLGIPSPPGRHGRIGAGTGLFVRTSTDTGAAAAPYAPLITWARSLAGVITVLAALLIAGDVALLVELSFDSGGTRYLAACL
jgi:hypothetical protein